PIQGLQSGLDQSGEELTLRREWIRCVLHVSSVAPSEYRLPRLDSSLRQEVPQVHLPLVPGGGGPGGTRRACHAIRALPPGPARSARSAPATRRGGARLGPLAPGPGWSGALDLGPEFLMAQPAPGADLPAGSIQDRPQSRRVGHQQALDLLL